MWANQNTSMDLICPRRLQYVAPELPLGRQEAGGVGENKQGHRRQLEPCASGLGFMTVTASLSEGSRLGRSRPTG